MLSEKIADGLPLEDAQVKEIARCQASVDITVSNHLEQLRALKTRVRAFRTKLDDDAALRDRKGRLRVAP